MVASVYAGLLATAPLADPYKKAPNDLDFPTGERQSKTESNLRAALALLGYAMYPLRDGGYLVCKSGYPQYAGDLEQLEALVVRPGGKPYA